MKFFTVYPCFFSISKKATLGFCLLFFLLACNKSGRDSSQDSAISGTVKVVVDESFQPVIEAERNTFESLYPKGKVTAEYMSETDALNFFLNGDAEMAIISRELNEEELKFFRSKSIVPRMNKLATEAVALIIHKENPDSTFTLTGLKDIFSGKQSTWKDLAGQSVEIVMDKASSSNLIYIHKKFGLASKNIKIYAAGSNSKVIEYVKNNQNALGVIGVNWISDKDDPTIKENLKHITIVAVAQEENNKVGFVKPSQSALADSTYPLSRSMLMINKEIRSGLGTGFASFMMSDPGQRIILKSGLLPAIMPGRQIEIK